MYFGAVVHVQSRPGLLNESLRGVFKSFAVNTGAAFL